MGRDDNNRDAVRKSFGNHAADKDWNSKRGKGCMSVVLPVGAISVALVALLRRR